MSLTAGGFPATVRAGFTNPFTVTAFDAFANVATGYTGAVTLTSSDPQAAFTPTTYTFTAADAGRKVVPTTLKTASVQSVTATDGGGLTAQQTGIIVTPAAASSLAISGFPAAVVAGTTNTLTLTAIDAFGNRATGYRGTVGLTSTDAAAVFPTPLYTFTAADAGAHPFTGVILKTAGTRR